MEKETLRSLATPQRDRSRTRRSRSRSQPSAGRRQGRSCSRPSAGGRQSRSRSRSRSRPSAGRSQGHSSNQSRHRRLLERELALRDEEERLLHMKLQLGKDREQRRRSSEQRSLRGVETRPRRRSRSRLPGSSDGRDRVPTSAGHRSNRSRSPTFSAKDVINIINSIKDALPSHQSNQSTQITPKSLDCKNIIPEFNPSEKNQRMDTWLRKVNECAKVYGWDERTIIYFAMQKLTGLAKTWYESLNSILYSWDEWQQKLINAFPCEQNYGQVLEDMLKRKSRPNELIENYYYEKLSLLNQCEIVGRRAVDCIIHGISDRTMRSSTLALRCDDPDQLLKFLLSSNKEVYLQPPQLPSKDKHFNAPEDRTNARSSNKNNPNLYCYNFKEKGHPFAKCPKPLLKCHHCNKVGHKLEFCRFKQDTPFTKGDSVAKTMVISTPNANPCDKFIKTVCVSGTFVEAFVDLGSEVTMIRQSTLIQLGLIHDHTPSLLRGFGNNLVHSVGSIKLDLSIDGVTATVLCKVVDDCLLERSMLIGQSYSEQPHVVIYKDSQRLQFLNITAEVPAPNLGEDDERLEKVRVVGHTVLFSAASVKAVAETSFTGNIILNTKIVGKPNEQYLVCGGVYEVKNGVFFVTVTLCSIPCRLQKNFIFSRAERLHMVYRLTDVNDAVTLIQPVDVPSPIKDFDESQVHIGDSVKDKDKAELVELLKRHKECFAFDLADLGCSTAAEMKIELTSQQPIVYRPYRLLHHEREKVRIMIDDMLKAGIIRESVSNYASPIILVRKKDGSIRLCVDFRKLNTVTVKERYPIPIIEDEISRLAGQAWFITLDLMSGYYQVPISEESKHLTAFVTPDGQYEYNRMPFGLANAPAVFQRMMNHVLGPARYNKATVYIDDLLIFGQSPKECMSHLEEVLKLLQTANLKLNLSKCSFLHKKINYLGYEISLDGMRPGLTKIRSVMEFPRPENVHNVRQFLGLVSYFRKFIQGFAQLANPLTKLLKRNVSWEWKKDQNEAFETLKARLIERPVLVIYDPAAETEVHTDASRLGVGGILLQRPRDSNGSFHPVAYYSRQTSPEKKNFHSYELETLAVVCALKKFRVYLLGKAFKVVTDCSALRSTFQKRDLIPRIARWWLALQEFDCTVEYRAGSRMGHVDALSRNPIEDPETQNPEQCLAVMIISNEDWLLTLQLGDPELCRIRDIVNSNLDPKGLEYIKNNYTLKDNKLFRCIGSDKECIRWVVPKGARWQLCKLNHDDIGHVGFDKTLERIKKNYWFAKMKRFIKKYVGACIKCAYAKSTANAREGLLHPIEKVEIPFHTLHIDHLEPFVKSKTGYTHILTTVYSFTKFVLIKPVRNTNTQNVIKVLQEIFDTFRVPDRLVSDRGSCFTSHAFRRFCLDRGIKHILNAVASPRANGQVERYNRTILDSLTAQNLRDDDKDWDNKLGKIQWGLNNTIQKTIGKTPAEVMFGMKMNSESNPIMNEVAKKSCGDLSLQSILAEVKERIDKNQVTQKKYYDQGRVPASLYHRGDLVKITKVNFNNDGKSSKLMPSFEGPYRVVKVLGNDRYKVAPIAGFEGMKNKRKTTVAADRMRPWIHLTSLEVDDDYSVDENVLNDASDEDNMSE